MSDREHAEEILETARRDLRAVRAMHDTESFPDEIFGFHAQQSVEKALKAWVALLGKQFPKTHDIKRLIDVLRENGIVTETLEPFVDLNAFAVQYRYEPLSARRNRSIGSSWQPESNPSSTRSRLLFGHDSSRCWRAQVADALSDQQRLRRLRVELESHAVPGG